MSIATTYPSGTPLLSSRLPTPLGPMLLAAGPSGALRGCWFEDRPATGPRAQLKQDLGPTREARAQLGAYFAGDLESFDLQLNLIGTRFQREVWRELSEIRFGSITSYGEIARRLPNAPGARAVGSAVGSNPLSIVIPCHRVVGSTGKLVGYGGGLDKKRWLLEHEAALRPERP